MREKARLDRESIASAWNTLTDENGITCLPARTTHQQAVVMRAARERKTKSTKKERGPRDRKEHRLTHQELANQWDDDAMFPMRGGGGGGKKGKKSRSKRRDDDDEEHVRRRRADADVGVSLAGQRRRGEMGAINLQHLSATMFMSWEELLDTRQALKQRMDTIAAVHGWEGKCGRRGFLGGVEPAAFLQCSW